MIDTAEPRRLRADAARNRQALLDAAARLFTERGLSVTLDDIAAEAGVNVATAYRHFANKYDLAAAFLEQKVDQVIAIAEETTAASDPWRGLVELLERILVLMTDNRDLHDVLISGAATDWLDRLDTRVDPLVEGLLKRARAAGVVRPEIGVGDIGVVLQMLAAVGDLPAADETLLRRYLAVVLDGLRPAPSRLPGRSPNPAHVRVAASRTRGGRA